MPVPPDQFQKRTYVKLPYTDALLRGQPSRAVKEQLRRAFEKPLLRVSISREVDPAHPLGLPGRSGTMYGDGEFPAKPPK